MNRRGSGAEIGRCLETARVRYPVLLYAQAFITGLPGEGEAEFESSAPSAGGCLKGPVFSPFTGGETPAAGMERNLDVETAQHRCDLLVSLQSRIMDEFNQSRLGSIIKVMAEDYDRLAEYWYGRSYADSPDVDGKIVLAGCG